MNFEEVVKFHGHTCPGLAMGYRMSLAALEAIGSVRSGDEELVAIVENDACGVDAVQFLTGCTFGKGNLIFRDYGKHVYTFFNRRTGQGVRISEDYRGFEGDSRFSEIQRRREAGEDVTRDLETFKMAKAAAILKAAETELFSVKPVTSPLPDEAKIRASARCAVCGEKFMESRGRMRDGKKVCIPCFEKK